MKKIPSVFQRNYQTDRLIRDEVVAGCEWVIAGEGKATRKWDGTACRVQAGRLYKRYDAKGGKQPPPGFEPAQDPDPETGHWPGWVPVGEGNDERWAMEAFGALVLALPAGSPPPDGTYELVGPKVNGNNEGETEHRLIPHGVNILEDAPRTFAALREYLSDRPLEGIVFHHPDGRMAKVKRSDFGHAWGRKGVRQNPNTPLQDALTAAGRACQHKGIQTPPGSTLALCVVCALELVEKEVAAAVAAERARCVAAVLGLLAFWEQEGAVADDRDGRLIASAKVGSLRRAAALIDHPIDSPVSGAQTSETKGETDHG